MKRAGKEVTNLKEASALAFSGSRHRKYSGSTRYWKGITLSESEGQQGQLGQEGHKRQDFPVSLHAKENIGKVL
jgi:hypothetical protein